MKDQANFGKFENPRVTATGDQRATVSFSKPETIWFNTGTLCNIECANCYIASSPTNDDLVYLTANEVDTYLSEIETLGLPIREIGFTGGEPFINPDILPMLKNALERGFDVLVLTNAMRPMMRPRVQAGLIELATHFRDRLTLRVSLDHHSRENHDLERGKGGFDKTLKGMNWLRDQGIKMAIAGRSIWGESDADARKGYKALIDGHGYTINPENPAELVIFPEMDATVEVPEITTACWGILNKSPDAMMCASSRMVVRRKGAEAPVVLACTLLAYDPQFEMGATLSEAQGDVSLNHPHCAKFCVFGGASCS
jgi:uncharacterized Fe-S cluster-containing radical SAM superfamily protein